MVGPALCYTLLVAPLLRASGHEIYRRARSYLDTSPGDATLDGMEIRLAPDQEAHLAALAARAGRSAAELVQVAVAEWEERRAEREAPMQPQHSPAEAAAPSRRAEVC